MLRTAILIERADIRLGGAERSTAELCAELRRQGVEATILAARGEPSEHTRILCGQAGKRTSLKTFEEALQRHLAANRYDIIHSTLPVSGADIYQPRGGSYRETIARTVASYPHAVQRFLKRSTHALNWRRLEYLRAEAKVCSRGSRTVIAALSGYVREQFKRHYNVADERIAVIGNGVNTDFSRDLIEDRRQRETIFRFLRIGADRPCVLFLFAANNPRLKGLGPLLKAFKQAIEQSRDVYPVLVVAGSKGFGTFGGCVRKFGLAKYVYSMHAGEGIWALLAGCDTAVLPTYYDPCSRFILEALAMAKPVITSRYNGAAERFANGRHGIVVDEPDDVNGLTRALLYFCEPARIELARRAIAEDNLRQDVSIRRHVEELIGLYREILSRKK